MAVESVVLALIPVVFEAVVARLLASAALEPRYRSCNHIRPGIASVSDESGAAGSVVVKNDLSRRRLDGHSDVETIEIEDFASRSMQRR